LENSNARIVRAALGSGFIAVIEAAADKIFSVILSTLLVGKTDIATAVAQV
jgi:hypothetical protein